MKQPVKPRPADVPAINFKPFHDRVLVLRAKEEETNTNIVIPDNDKEPPLEGRVIEVGAGRFEFGQWIQPSVAVGDVVLFAKYAGVPVSVDGTEYLLLRDEELLGARVPAAPAADHATHARRAVPRVEQEAEGQ